jgi:tetratricopeptide (TPR) repeat protein
LSFYLAGVAREALPDIDGAMRAYEAALAARPQSQSASLRLSVLRQLRGDASGAYALVQESLDARPTDADPWRVFLYGHYPQFPALIAAVRRQVPR